MAIKMDGKALADKIAIDLKQRTSKLKENGIQPELIIVTASKDEASKIYVRNKIKRAEEVGIKVEHIITDSLTREIMEYVRNRNVPCIVQMPFDSNELTIEDLGKYITSWNDVDGFCNKVNVAELAMGQTPPSYPATPKGIMRLLKEYNIDLEGKLVCCVGRSNTVGRPMARMLEHEGATVTVCHSKTYEDVLASAVLSSDIVVSAIGNPNVFSEAFADLNMSIDSLTDFLQDKIIIDVGVNRVNGHIVGDIPQEIKDECYMYTPSIGGVGPLTVISLIENVVETYEKEMF